MSVKVMDRVWELSRAKGASRLVLLALADWADDEGYCYPSLTTIARKTLMTKVGVMKVLHRLEKDLHEIEVTVRGHNSRDRVRFKAPKGGFQPTNYYRVVVGNVTYRPQKRTVANGSSEGGQHYSIEVVNPGDQSATASLNDPSVDPSIEPSVQTCDSDAPLLALKSTDLEELALIRVRFEHVCDIYPRVDKKKRAWKLFQRLNPTDSLTDLIIRKVEEQKRSVWGGVEPRFIPSLLNYLNDERWTDEVSDVAPYSASELDKAQRIRASRYLGRCPHNPSCEGDAACLKSIAGRLREEQRRPK